MLYVRASLVHMWRLLFSSEDATCYGRSHNTPLNTLFVNMCSTKILIAVFIGENGGALPPITK
jgi:hypothetical protein